MSDVRAAVCHGKSDHRREPFCGDAIEIDPTPDVLCWQAEPSGESGNLEPVDDRGKEHDGIATRNVTQINTEDEISEAARTAARKRLKRLRQDRRLSVEELAAQIERSPSSVRAHENGQNGISRKAAYLYAQALEVSPSFILWGTSDELVSEASASVREVPLIGELAGDIWLDAYDEAVTGSVTVSLPEYVDFDLKAFLVGRSSRHYRRGDYVVVAPPEVGVRADDHVVVRIDDNLGRTKLSLTQADITTSGVALRPISGGADRVGVRTAWNSASAKDDVTVTVVGPVVAYGGKERPSSGPIIRPSQLMALNRLA